MGKNCPAEMREIMKMVIEHFITFLLLLIFIWIGIAYIIQNVLYSSAREFHGSVVTQVENSYFDTDIIEDCKKRAEKAGYELKVQVYGEENKKDAKITLGFQYVIPLAGIVKKYEIEGYSR